MAEEKTGLYNLDDADHATVLAALRIYQRELNLNGGAVPEDVRDIATNGDTVDPLTDSEIDELCEGLNHTGLSFGDVVNLIGDDGSDNYVLAALEHPLLEEGTLEVDVPTIVSRGDDGAYVMAWIHVPDPEKSE